MQAALSEEGAGTDDDASLVQSQADWLSAAEGLQEKFPTKNGHKVIVYSVITDH